MKKKMTKFFGNGKNTMSVWTFNYLERHGSGSVNGIFIATGRTKTAFAPKRYKFVFTTGATAVHGTAKRRVATIEHTVYVFHDGSSWVSGI